MQVLFEIFSACVGMEIKLKEMDWPTLQSIYRRTILDLVMRRVCSLIYSLEFYLRKKAEGNR